MTRKLTFFCGLVVVAAACTNSSGDTTSDTLLTTPATTTTTLASTSTTSTPTTTIAPTTTTTNSTTTPPATTSTTVVGTDVAGAGDGNTVDTLVQLPFTGAEPEVTVVAVLALLLGVWLVQRSGLWQLRLARLEARWWRRPGAPPADPAQPQPWPPNALVPATDADRQFRLKARTLADRYGVTFMEGVDAYATRWVASVDPAGQPGDSRGDPVSRWQAHLVRELRRIYNTE